MFPSLAQPRPRTYCLTQMSEPTPASLPHRAHPTHACSPPDRSEPGFQERPLAKQRSTCMRGTGCGGLIRCRLDQGTRWGNPASFKEKRVILHTGSQGRMFNPHPRWSQADTR